MYGGNILFKIKEGNSQTYIEEYYRQENKPIGDKIENSSKQEGSVQKYPKANTSNVFPKDTDGGNRERDKFDGTGYTTSNPREQLAPSEGTLLPSDLSFFTDGRRSSILHGKSNRSKLLLSLSDQKEI